MAESSIEDILELLEVPEGKRRRLALRAGRTVQEMGLVEFSHVYRVVINEVERLDIPYSERFVISLDAPRSDDDSRTLLDKLPAPEHEKQEAEPLSIAQLPRKYAPFVSELRELLGVDATDVLLNSHVVRIDTLRDRIAKLRRIKKQRLYVIPPERPVKELYFAEDNNLVLTLGRLPRGCDAIAYYGRWYEGVYLEDLCWLNNALYQKLRSDGRTDEIPRRKAKPRNWRIIDPVDVYMRDFYPMRRSLLRDFDSGLYFALRRQGKLSVIPKAKPRPRFSGVFGKLLNSFHF